MESQKLLFLILLCSSILLLLGIEAVHCTPDYRHGPKMLFVFGDSYADTGNDRNPAAPSWKKPYGITFPGKPTGRFSDGRVFTDFLARFLRLKSPIPYILRKYTSNHVKYGMNFAHGGTGVFDTTFAPYPNMTTQIDIFQGLINQGIFTPQDLQYSVAHVSLAGNDYSNYLANGGTFQGFSTFTPKVINQLTINLQRIKKLGVKKISVTTLEPLGCLPGTTYTTNFTKCNELSNNATQVHNLILQKALSTLNNQTGSSSSSPFVSIDLYKAFLSVLLAPQVEHRKPIFKNPLATCCKGINATYVCGELDKKGNKMYTLCPNPNSYFFWDRSHPSQAGWQSVLPFLQSSIQQLLY